jgi:glutamate/tyrosine decarboxylase-like PLP-dependent enzyme
MASERVRFPLQGASNERVLEALEGLRANDVPAHGTRNFRAVYYVDDETLDLINLAATAYAEVNAAYGNTSFPSVWEIERQLVTMGLDLLHAPAGAGGSVTTGGTESNFMVVKTARDYFRARHPEREQFEMIVPHTATPRWRRPRACWASQCAACVTAWASPPTRRRWRRWSIRTRS